MIVPEHDLVLPGVNRDLRDRHEMNDTFSCPDIRICWEA
jgi:hypothetical protein